MKIQSKDLTILAVLFTLHLSTYFVGWLAEFGVTNVALALTLPLLGWRKTLIFLIFVFMHITIQELHHIIFLANTSPYFLPSLIFLFYGGRILIIVRLQKILKKYLIW